MSMSYTIDHAVLRSVTNQSVLMAISAKSELALQLLTDDPKTGEISASYILTSGDPAFPAVVTFRCSPQKRKGKAVKRLSVTFDTWAVQTDSVSGIVTREEVSSSVTAIVPAVFTVEVDDVVDLIENCFSFLYPSVAAGVIDTSYVGKLLYGVPRVVA
jgi:hypothetical protein